MQSEAADDLHTIADDDARLRRASRASTRRWLEGTGRRRRRGGSQTIEGRRSPCRGGLDAASDAATAARKARQAAAEAVRSAVEACRVGRSGEKDDKTRRSPSRMRSARGSCEVVEGRVSVRTRASTAWRQKGVRGSSTASDHAAASVAQLDIRNVKDQYSEFQNALDADKAAKRPGGARRGKQARSSTGGGEGGEALEQVHPADEAAPAKKKGVWFA